MVVTNVATLKASLSELLANVKAGEEVVVTERGRPVARIVPYEPGGDELDDLVRTGRMRRSRSHVPGGGSGLRFVFSRRALFRNTKRSPGLSLTPVSHVR